MFHVKPGTIAYWASVHHVSSIQDPTHPRRRLYHLGEMSAAAVAQQAKREARKRNTP